jgi:hypothetical protein
MVSSGWGETKSCGMVGCAGGWAASDPGFNRAGLRHADFGFMPRFAGAVAEEAIADFFGLTDDEAKSIVYDFNATKAQTIKKIETFANAI